MSRRLVWRASEAHVQAATQRLSSRLTPLEAADTVGCPASEWYSGEMPERLNGLDC